MALNEQQMAIVGTLDGSVNVIAGAGTGKTFTLTQRIVASIEKCVAEGDYGNPIEHVLAITFTKKAAAELRGRVRDALMQRASEGGPLGEVFKRCATNMDNAWISTIHSMAGRILRENAIEFGIDPEFEVLSSQAENMIFAQAVDESLEQLMASDNAKMKEFLGFADSDSAGRKAEFAIEAVRALQNATGYMPDGLNGISYLVDDFSIKDSLSSFYRAAVAAEEAFQSDGWKPGDAKKLPELIDQISDAMKGYGQWSGADEEEICSNLLSLQKMLFAFPPTTNAFGLKSPFASEMAEYRKSYQDAANAILMRECSNNVECLIAFTNLVQANLISLKNHAGRKFTESDLLTAVNEYLAMPEYEHIRERYQRQFKCIMLDEFQDTDKLQMSIISKISAYSGEGNSLPSNVCTVGDMQQSIYRFRGGDVEETQKRIASIEEGGGYQFKLSKNYRSHSDILDTVERIFSRQGAFGADFLKLEACCPSLDELSSQIFAGSPRIIFDFLHSTRQSSKREGASKAAVRQIAAANIASHFKSLADQGVRPSKMALLLGAMSNAGIYAKAISDAGLECAITGGSVFAESPVVQLVCSLLKYAVSSQNEDALLQILLSDMFEISDDVLLSLVRFRVGDNVLRSSLSESFNSSSFNELLSDDDVRSLGFARNILSEFRSNAWNVGASYALRRLFARSGFLQEISDDITPENIVRAGNIKKALSIVESIENRALGLAEVSSRFDSHIENAKEGPGSLFLEDSDFIQIMTVHASKGLEFDHVAIAELRDGSLRQGGGNPIIENVDSKTFVMLKPSKGDFIGDNAQAVYKKVASFTFDDGFSTEDSDLSRSVEGEGISRYEESLWDKKRINGASSAHELTRLLSEYQKKQEVSEARRLMYVAMTRARESLYVSLVTLMGSSPKYTGAFEEMANALYCHFGLVEEDASLNFDIVQMPIRFKRRVFESSADIEDALGEAESTGTADGNAAKHSRTVPIYKDSPLPSADYSNKSRDGLLSYTSLSEHAPEPASLNDDNDDGVPLPHSLMSFDDEVTMSLDAIESAREESATALGTAFHLLSELSICKMGLDGSASLEAPSEKTVMAKADAYGLSQNQKSRLDTSLKRWFTSDVARQFASYDAAYAEVPFSVRLSEGDSSFVLEGEIDGLAFSDEDMAFLIDYKTGVSTLKTQEFLEGKHRFQSQCYAYALLTAGFKKVVANFVRVEDPSPDDPEQPMNIQYVYDAADERELKSVIMRAYSNCSS